MTVFDLTQVEPQWISVHLWEVLTSDVYCEKSKHNEGDTTQGTNNRG